MRLTAQRLLGDHLRRPDGVSGEDAQHFAPSPDESYWPNMGLDLTGAFLIGLDLREASVVDARFAMATFSTSGAVFDRATFIGDAVFEGATFTGDARFEGATFIGDARFHRATFTGAARFRQGDLHRRRLVRGVTFTGDALFEEVTFTGDARFVRATFTVDAWFRRATFTGTARFDEATFTVDAYFERATLPATPGSRGRLSPTSPRS